MTARTASLLKCVSLDKWRDGIKFLTGDGVNPSLSRGEQRQLRHRMTQSRKMSTSEAILVLREIGWVEGPR